MSIESELVKSLSRGLEAFAKFMFNDHKELIEKTAKRVNKQVDSVDNIISLAKELTGAIPEFVANLASDPQKNVKVAKEFKEKGEKIVEQVNKVLKRNDKIAKDLKPALSSLQKTLTTAFKDLKQSFKGVMTRKKSVLTGLHQHLKGEQSFKQHARQQATPTRHLNIPKKGSS